MTDFSPTALKRLLEDARRLRPVSYERRVAELRDFWNDRSGAHLTADIESTFSDPDIRDSVAKSGLTLPLTRRIVRKLARLYRTDPARRIRLRADDGSGSAGTEPLRTAIERRYHSLCADSELTAALRTAQELFTLTGLAFIRAGFDGELFFECFAGDELLIIPAPGAPMSDPSRYAALIVPHVLPNGAAEYAWWSADHHFVFAADGEIVNDFGDPELKNPYGRIPFVRIDGRGGDLYPEPPESLVRANRVLNFALTELFYTIKFQCFGQPVWVSDDDTQPDFKVGVQHLIHVVKRDQAASGDFRFESPNAPIQPVKETIFEVARLAALLEGVPADTVDTQGRVESGVARWLAHSDNLEARASEVTRFRNAERDLFKIVSAIISHHRPAEALRADLFTVEVDFNDSAPDLTPAEERTNDEADLRLGVLSPLDILRRRNPDLSRLPDDDVLRIWRRNLELAGEASQSLSHPG